MVRDGLGGSRQKRVAEVGFGGRCSTKEFNEAACYSLQPELANLDLLRLVVYYTALYQLFNVYSVWRDA